nr:MAG TPA: hypothetical protein [Caudoviricetes sp.]
MFDSSNVCILLFLVDSSNVISLAVVYLVMLV